MGCGSSTPSSSKETPNSNRSKNKTLNSLRTSLISTEEHSDLCKKKLFSSAHSTNSINNKSDKIIKVDTNALPLSPKSLIINPSFSFGINNPTNNISLPNSFKYTNGKLLKHKDKENDKSLTPQKDPLYSGMMVGMGDNKKELKEINRDTNSTLLMHYLPSQVPKKESDSISDRTFVRSTVSPRNRFRLKRPKSPQMCNF